MRRSWAPRSASRSRDTLDKLQPALGLAEVLHLRGELWTFELDGVVHVFTTPHSPSDDALAPLRPPLTACKARITRK